MAPIRVRHPKGVSTIQVDFNTDTVQDLQTKIFSVSEIYSSEQELKGGYPPQSLTIIPELPVDSLGLKQGDQLVVTQKSGSTPVAPSSSVATPAKSKVTPGPIPRADQGSNSQLSAGKSDGADYVETPLGALVHRIVPDDNSCMFSSVALVFEQDISQARKIRQIVADAIRADPITWDEAILGRPQSEYISTILRPTAWGGAIELSILATHYNTEIASIDVETGRIDHFQPSGPSHTPSATSSGNRGILIYSGIHYDAASLAPIPDAPPDFHQTLFPILATEGNDDADPIMRAAKELVAKLRQKKLFTNTATFDLKCEICGTGLRGEKEARVHAKDTGHTQFGEY